MSWFSRLLTDQVYPAPDSDTRKPNDGLAITLIHGAGVALPRAEDRDVLAARPSAKPPSPLKNSSSGRGAAASAPVSRAGAGARERRARPGALEADDLLGERAPAARAGRPGRPPGAASRSSAESWSPRRMKTPPRTGRPACGQRRPARPHERLERVVEVLGVGGAVLVEDDEVDVEALHPPVLVGAEQLPHDVDVLELVDPDQDDRAGRRRCRGPRAPAAPARLRASVSPTAGATGRRRGSGWRAAGRGAPRRRSMPRWCSWTWACVQARVGRALEGGRVAVLVGEVEDAPRATRRRPSRRSAWAVAPGASADPAAEAEDRVEHRRRPCSRAGARR